MVGKLQHIHFPHQLFLEVRESVQRVIASISLGSRHRERKPRQMCELVRQDVLKYVTICHTSGPLRRAGCLANHLPAFTRSHVVFGFKILPRWGQDRDVCCSLSNFTLFLHKDTRIGSNNNSKSLLPATHEGKIDIYVFPRVNKYFRDMTRYRTTRENCFFISLLTWISVKEWAARKMSDDPSEVMLEGRFPIYSRTSLYQSEEQLVSF